MSTVSHRVEEDEDPGGGGAGEIHDEDDDDDEIDDGPTSTRRNYPKEVVIDHTCEVRKKVSLFKFRDVKKKLLLPEKWRRRRGRRMKSGGGVLNSGCFVCLKRPLTLDSSVDSPTTDPNSPEFTSEMLRLFIEKNDFYDNDCNPHLDDDL